MTAYSHVLVEEEVHAWKLLTRPDNNIGGDIPTRMTSNGYQLNMEELHGGKMRAFTLIKMKE